MMKPEPLEGKEVMINYPNKNKYTLYHKSLDVRSAVEWLKYEFRNIHYLQRMTPIAKQRLFDKINEAFADVIEKPKKTVKIVDGCNVQFN